MGKYLTGWPSSPLPDGGASDAAPCSPSKPLHAEGAAASAAAATGSSRRVRTTAVPAPSLPYDLLAVVNHSGSMAQGHYTAFVKEIGRWFRFDDTWVREVDEEEVLASEAYILFYFQRGADAAWRPPHPVDSTRPPSPAGGSIPQPPPVFGNTRL